MTKTILVTRPKDDSDALTEALHSKDMRVIHEPLMEIFLRHDQRHALEKALYDEPDALIVTSRHGVRALAALTNLRDLLLICVGDATARTAESLGFTRVYAGGGNADSLLDYLMSAYDEDTRFLYISGEHTRIDIAAALTEYGMQAERIVLYHAIASEHLCDTLMEQLKRGQIDAVTFLSERTAKIFVNLLAKANMHDAAAQLHAFALSKAVSAPLESFAWQGLHVSRQPTLASLLECIDNTLAR